MSRRRGHKGHGAGPHNQNGNGNNRNNNNNNSGNGNGSGNGNHRNGNRNGNRNNGNNNSNNNNNGGYNNGSGNGNNNNNHHRNRNGNNRNGNGGHGGNNGNNGKNGNPAFGHPLSQILNGYFQQRQNRGGNNGQGSQCRYNPCTRGNCQRAHAPGQQTSFQGGGPGPVRNQQQRQQGDNGGDASRLARLTLCRNNPCTDSKCHWVHAPGQRTVAQGGGHPGQNNQQTMFLGGGGGGGASSLLKMFQQLHQQVQQQQPFFVDDDGDVIMCECGGHPEDPSFCCRDQYELLWASNPSLERSGKALAEFSAALYNEMGLGRAHGQGMGPEDLMRMLEELFALGAAAGGGGPRRKGRRGGAQAGPFANPGFMQDAIQ